MTHHDAGVHRHSLYPAHGVEPRAQLHRELFREPAPVLLTYLIFEPVQYFSEHLFEIILRMGPGGDRVAEIHEVVHNPGGVHLDHLTDAAEGGVLLVVVAYVPKRCAPVTRHTSCTPQ